MSVVALLAPPVTATTATTAGTAPLPVEVVDVRVVVVVVDVVSRRHTPKRQFLMNMNNQRPPWQQQQQQRRRRRPRCRRRRRRTAASSMPMPMMLLLLTLVPIGIVAAAAGSTSGSYYDYSNDNGGVGFTGRRRRRRNYNSLLFRDELLSRSKLLLPSADDNDGDDCDGSSLLPHRRRTNFENRFDGGDGGGDDAFYFSDEPKDLDFVREGSSEPWLEGRESGAYSAAYSSCIPSNGAAGTTTLKTTGTTIVGVLGGSYVVLAADTRATAGSAVADKRADKLHRISPLVWACGAGTSADLDQLTRLAGAVVEQQQKQYLDAIGNDDYDSDAENDPRPSRRRAVVSAEYACRFLQDELYEQSGNCQANLIVGGVSSSSSSSSRLLLRAIHPHGSSDTVRYCALGSGGLAATAVLEQGYRPDMTRDEAVELAKRAVLAGIRNDLGSGSQVDVVVIDAVGGAGAATATRFRAAVPEEILPDVVSKKAPSPTRPKLVAEDDSIATADVASEAGYDGGVNGFGNLPFAVKSSRRLLLRDDDDDDAVTAVASISEEQKWNDLLGL